MNSERVHTIEVTEQEKALFQQWLQERQNELFAQLQTIKSLIEKLGAATTLDSFIDATKPELFEKYVAPLTPNPKWAAKSLAILKGNAKHWFDSSEVVDTLMKTDPLSASLPRVEVMRGVSSRLNQLTKREQAEKKEIDGRIHYRYLKD